MGKIDKVYHNILRGIKDSGYEYETENRPGVKMKQLTSANFEESLVGEFPLLTTKKMFFKGIVAELIWFLRGYDNVEYLHKHGVHIWDDDAYNYYVKVCEEFGDEPLTSEEYWNLTVGKDMPIIGSSFKVGDVGYNYGVQWKKWTDVKDVNEHKSDVYIVNQIDELLNNLRKSNPISRRHIVTAWNPAELDETALPPCHWAFEIIPRPLNYRNKMSLCGGDVEYLNTLWDQAFLKKDDDAKKQLDKEVGHIPDYGFTLKWHQRSVDTFLGLPFNIASYGLLANIIGLLTGIAPLSLIGDLSNVHVYPNHWDAVDKQLNNNPGAYPGPRLVFSKRMEEFATSYRNEQMSFEEFIGAIEPEDISLEGYQSFGKLSAKMVAPTKQ